MTKRHRQSGRRQNLCLEPESLQAGKAEAPRSGSGGNRLACGRQAVGEQFRLAPWRLVARGKTGGLPANRHSRASRLQLCWPLKSTPRGLHLWMQRHPTMRSNVKASRQTPNEGVEKVPEGSMGIDFGGLLTLPGPAIAQYAPFYEAFFRAANVNFPGGTFSTASTIRFRGATRTQHARRAPQTIKQAHRALRCYREHPLQPVVRRHRYVAMRLVDFLRISALLTTRS